MAKKTENKTETISEETPLNPKKETQENKEDLYTFTELLDTIENKEEALLKISTNGYIDVYLNELKDKYRGLILTPTITKKEFNKIIK